MIQGMTRDHFVCRARPLGPSFPCGRRRLGPIVGLSNKVSDEDEPGYCGARQRYLQPPQGILAGLYLESGAWGGCVVECLIVAHQPRVPRCLTARRRSGEGAGLNLSGLPGSCV